MVQAVIENEKLNVPVVASRGKQVRAEPIVAFYEQGKVKHLCKSAELEQQMTLMTHLGYEGDEASPDRLDAMVWAMTELSTDDGRCGSLGPRIPSCRSSNPSFCHFTCPLMARRPSMRAPVRFGEFSGQGSKVITALGRSSITP